MSYKTAYTRVTWLVFILSLLLAYVNWNSLQGLGLSTIAWASESPFFYRLTGLYHQEQAERSRLQATQYYRKAFKRYQEVLPTLSEDEQAIANFALGDFYSCGQGTEQDLEKAKQHFDRAAQGKNHMITDEALKRAEKLLQKLEQIDK